VSKKWAGDMMHALHVVQAWVEMGITCDELIVCQILARVLMDSIVDEGTENINKVIEML
jgi:hypothetical protein